MIYIKIDYYICCMILKKKSDEYFMKQALSEAHKALELDEVPVGAVIVCDNQIIARGHNLMQRLNDATAHAEMQVFASATNYLGNKYLNHCTLFVTLEPCLMCAAASYWAQIGRLVYAASDTKRRYSFKKEEVYHPKTLLTKGILEVESSKLLSDFFSKKR